ncbi:MATE family efflux transporter [Parvularcula dongshanensis]|uniref:MATE family multidrug resistance protein n=1 Tax=Parvularcula dongshanensis TaxID=1173995 RepID=A0A840I634_9PROT|nr:MATE family efflux transporter [Parvularcula dongshanensis]MBB4659775.1 MATE family multidrug resistance protein [Parvularcula dongshanensis]
MAARSATVRSAFALAWPASLAAIVTPVLGLIDAAVLARAAGPTDMAGVALAAAVFSLLYWSFGFLRMSVAGLTAQADGRNDEGGVRVAVVQGLLIAAAVGFSLLLLKSPIAALSEVAMTHGTEASDGAAGAMRTYLAIRLFAAPCVMVTNALVGSLTGQGRMRAVMIVMLSVTALNALLDVVFVMGMGMGVAGIALGTAIAETVGALLAGLAVLRALERRGGVRLGWNRARLTEGWRAVLSLNLDIFLRTLVLSLVFAWFVRAGGQFGDVTLAANEVLLNLVLVPGLFLDGPAIAAETLTGRALGAKNERPARFAAAVRATTTLSALFAGALFLVMLVLGGAALALIVPPGSDAAAILGEARRYLPYAIASPLVLAAAFQLDGLYIGATRGRALRNAMLVSGVVFTALILLLPDLIGNHGVWAAFGLFMLSRAATLLAAWPGFAALTRDVPPFTRERPQTI